MSARNKRPAGAGRNRQQDTRSGIPLHRKQCPVLEELYHDPDSKLHAQEARRGRDHARYEHGKGKAQPQVLVDTENLTREEWLDWRRRGIGGSDVSAIMGISPFRTARDIYYDKLGIAAVEENEGNWVAMEMGPSPGRPCGKRYLRRQGLKSIRSRRCSSIPFIRSCWQTWITLSPCRTDGRKPSWRSRPPTIMQKTTGGKTAGGDRAGLL